MCTRSDLTGLACRCESKEGPIVSLERARPKMCPAAKHVGPTKNLFLEQRKLYLYYFSSQQESPAEKIEIKSWVHHATTYIQNLKVKQTWLYNAQPCLLPSLHEPKQNVCIVD